MGNSAIYIPKNKGLYKYGIEEEGSDVRVHVCPVVEQLYTYRTCDGIKAIKNNKNLQTRYAGQKDYDEVTAYGYLVPPNKIDGCIVQSPARNIVWEKQKFRPEDDTSTKGRKAVSVVKTLAEYGCIPFFTTKDKVVEVEDEKMQIKGIDITIESDKTETVIQVKCDYRGGKKELGGTGNLFLQVAEKNPHKKY